MSAREAAIDAVKDYIYYLEDTALWLCLGNTLKDIGFATWAAYEMLVLLTNNDIETPLTIIEDFKREMHRLSKLNKNTGDVFAVAETSAEYIIDVLTT